MAIEAIGELVDRYESGDDQAVDRLLENLYGELHGIADRLMRSERPDHTLQPTALVNEAYLRLLGENKRNWNGRVHFLARASVTMRRILVDHARRKLALRRGGSATRITLHDDHGKSAAMDLDLLALDEALRNLAMRSERQARVIDLRFFGSLGVEEAADVMGVSPRTVKNETRVALAWLRREIAA